MTFQDNDIPEWGTLDKNLDRVQAIDRWFQGRFLPKKLFVFGSFMTHTSKNQSKDELKYFFSLMREDFVSMSDSKKSIYTKYLSSSTPVDQIYDKIFTKLAHLNTGMIKIPDSSGFLLAMIMKYSIIETRFSIYKRSIKSQ